MGFLEIRNRLGGGSYGRVYEAYWQQGRKLVAIKIERRMRRSVKHRAADVIPDFGEITNEYKVMKMFNTTVGFPLVYTGNMEGASRYYVMEKLGKSLRDLHKKAGGSLQKRIIVRVAFQLIGRIETVYERGLLVYDLHSGNVMLDEEGETLYLVD